MYLKERSSLDVAIKRVAALLQEPTTEMHLDLSNLGLTTLPLEIGQLRELKTLDVSGNHLTTLPPEIGMLRELKRLNVSRNQLTTLPPEIGKLGAMSILTAVDTQLTALPGEIGNLTALRELCLNSSQIATLPREIGELSSLRELWLKNNCLAELPREIRKLTALRGLWLHGNPGLGIPTSLLGSAWGHADNELRPAVPEAILDYYFARQDQGEAPMREVRLLLVGRGRVGKTSLLRVLRREEPNEEEKETPGITVLPLELTCAQGVARAHAWDFGGQEFLHGTHQIFLSERCVYVLVLEGRESNWEMETDYWLRFIRSYGEDSPVIVALNKYDAHVFSVDRYRLQERCPQIVGFVETDAFTGRGTAEMRGLLERTVDGMAHVWAGVPRKWHRVKEELTRMPKSFVEYRDYQTLCARMGVTDERQQDSLAETLHRLGIALNFREHHRLRETSVLKPQWVTEGIYGLLRFAQKNDCHGVLHRGWIGEALPAQDYPTEKHGFVMELMEKFEVAFALEAPEAAAGKPKHPERWLIPELLPEAQPAAFADFRVSGVRRLRFTYPQALPPGLLPRLIVRTHEMSSAHPDWRWRSGVVLEWNGAQALVRLDRNERRTEVAVRGADEAERQSLFDIIRAHLAVLHGKVPVIEEVEALDDPEKWVSMTDLRVAEQEEEKTLPVTVGAGAAAKRVKLPVERTLNMVESIEARVAESPKALRRMRLFVSYAHVDEKKLKALSTHLTILGRRGYIQPWDDRQLIAGEEWEERIFSELAQADIVLLLYSSESRASKFIQEKEAPRAVELRREKGCMLIVVPLDRKDWDDAVELEQTLKKIQTATWNAKPVLDFTPRRKGWQEVEQAIRKAVEARRKGNCI